MGVDSSKLTKELRQRLEQVPHDSLVEVIVEIIGGESAPAQAGASRADLIATRRQQFLETVAPVERRVHNMGGEVLGHAWVNQTLRVRVPAGTVDQLTESDCVASVDAPARLTRE
jgi:hypothetical protein